MSLAHQRVKAGTKKAQFFLLFKNSVVLALSLLLANKALPTSFAITCGVHVEGGVAGPGKL